MGAPPLCVGGGSCGLKPPPLELLLDELELEEELLDEELLEEELEELLLDEPTVTARGVLTT